MIFCLTVNNSAWLDHFVSTLSTQFALKDLDTLHHFLGVEVIPTVDGIFFCHKASISMILMQFMMNGAKDVSTPLTVSEKLMPLQLPGATNDVTQFRRQLGLMQYLVLTQPGVAFAVNRL